MSTMESYGYLILGSAKTYDYIHYELFPNILDDRKRLFDFPDNDEEDFLISTKKHKRSCEKPKYDLDLSASDGGAEKNIPPYVINLGKGLLLEIKKFRSSYYVGLSKVGEGSEVRNRFNIPLIQLETLHKGIEAMMDYVKNCR
ncbi:uncharacterized protein TNCT_82751 [Trichonephila clavata]|uniref:Uncharacterized protein n=1 Tax=Trichonephila clavata TaxID=2740835 RepID=A0A8X6H2H1_TRICU|nr:uncharacterized protein TNCT_82751 [Trichonephila clavata]